MVGLRLHFPLFLHNFADVCPVFFIINRIIAFLYRVPSFFDSIFLTELILEKVDLRPEAQ